MAKLLKPLGAAGSLPLSQHDPSHWPAADALDAGDQFRRARYRRRVPVVVHSVEDGRIGRTRCAESASLTNRSWLQRLRVTRRNHDGNAANGSSSYFPAQNSGLELTQDRLDSTQ